MKERNRDNKVSNGTDLVRPSVPEKKVAYLRKEFPNYLTSHSKPQNLRIYFDSKKKRRLKSK